MTTTFFLLRHAAHDNVGGFLAGRSPGIRLGEDGRAQAARLAERMRRESFEAIYSSPRERSAETAAAIAQAAESVGFQGGLIPSFPNTDDPWVISSLLARETKSFRFMIAFQPGFGNPVHTARMAASLQRATGGRLLFNIITGGGGPAQLWWGDSFAHDDRYGRTSEFLDIFKGVWESSHFSYDGRFYQLRDGGLAPVSASLRATQA